MKRSDFLACSVAFHILLLVLALLLPSPFPSKFNDSGMLYVDLAPEKDKRGGPRGERRYSPDDVRAYAPDEGGYVNKPLKPLALGRGDAPGHPRNTPAGPARPGPERPAPASPPTPPPPTKAEEPHPPAPQREAAATQAKVPQTAPGPASGTARDGGGTGAGTGAGISLAKSELDFRYQKGWPPPPMVRVELAVEDDGTAWRAERDGDWIIVSPASGIAPGGVSVGADVSGLSPGFYDGRVGIKPPGGAAGGEVYVTLIVLPKSKGSHELPHSSWDAYMNGDCKVCHMPEELLPAQDFMLKPEFCKLCHNDGCIAQDKVAAPGGHPVNIMAGSGTTKAPSRGTVAEGPKSDRMDTHLDDGKIVCVTCHNVMGKPGEYGRAWELAASSDQHNYYLERGGWREMGYYEPRVYAAPKIMKMPKRLKELDKYRAKPSTYAWDEAEGRITFRSARGRDDVIYVTLSNPYLRVTTEHNALCFDCHDEMTHAGLNCLDCHQAHGTDNVKAVRRYVRGPDGLPHKVLYKARAGKGSFADGGGAGICEVCHVPAHKGGKNYAGKDCTKCHVHSEGFGV